MEFKVALLQILPEKSLERNFSKGIDYCWQAKKEGANLALFPEMWSIGYDSSFFYPQYSIDSNHPFIKGYCSLAKELQMAIGVTYLGMGNERPTNSMMVIDRTGRIVLHYSKIHLCYFGEDPDDRLEKNLEEGPSFNVSELVVDENLTLNIGAMICFDREFPESARTLMLKKAEIILVPNSCTLSRCPTLGDVRLQQLRALAFENMVGIALANYPSPLNDGHSCAFNCDGKPIYLADEKEGLFIASFSIDEIRNWRDREVWGEKFRKPSKYL